MASGDRDRTRERDQLRERLQREGRTREQIAAAMTQEFGDRPRVAWRHAYGWTQKEVAALYNQEVKDDQQSVTANRISDYERWPRKGGRKPTIRAFSALAKVYSTRALNLIDSHDRRRLDAGELLALSTVEFVVVPRQLPGAIPNFVGRSRELGILTAQLDRVEADSKSAPTVITSIGGTAGIGKTTLAVHWARAQIDRFCDGQLYVDLHGFDPSGTPITPDTAIRGFLDAFQVPPEKIPFHPENQAALYRTLVEGKRLVIVLDNARDSDQVWPLLPGSPSCTVLITSRQQLGSLIARKQALHITLELMSTAEARQLLTQFLGAKRIHAEPDAVNELIRLCVGLPMALSIAAARILLDPHIPLSALVDQLREENQRLGTLSTGDSQLTDIRAVFSWSYTSLTPHAARLFRLLGLHPGPDIGTPAAASLAGLPEHDTSVLLSELTRAHLLKQHVPGRYQFHDLIRLYATEQATQEEPEPQRRAALQRALDYYLHTGFAAYQRTGFTAAGPFSSYWRLTTLQTPQPGVILPQITNYEQAQEWFTAEHVALRAVIDHAAAHGFDTYAWQLSWVIADFLYQRGRWHEWATLQQTALAITDRLGDLEAQAYTHHSLANAYTYLEDAAQAINHYQHALDSYRTLGNDEGQARVHDGLGWAYALHGQHNQAINSTRQALDFYQNIGDQDGQARLLNGLGWVYVLGKQHDQGVIYARQALELYRAINNQQGQAVALDTLSRAYGGLSEYNQAITYCQQAIDLYQTTGNKYFQAQTLARLGDVYHAVDDLTAARDTWQQALTIFDQLTHPDAEKVRTKLGL